MVSSKISLNPQTASAYLSRLAREAAGSTEANGVGLKSKGLQIADAMTDPDKRIKLKPDEVTTLLAHVAKLPAAEKAEATQCLDMFRDRFEIADPTAKQLFLDFIPKTATPILVGGGAVRSVQEAKLQAATPTPQASAKDIKQVDEVAEKAAAAAGGGANGDAMKAELTHAAQTAFNDGDVKVNPDARKAYVESVAKRPQDPAMSIFDKYARSPFFEDRLMAALGRNSLKFMTEMNEKMNGFDDPKRDEQVRGAFTDNMKKMLQMAERISPEGKARAATELKELLKTNPDLSKEAPALQEWVERVKSVPEAAAGASRDDVLKGLPPADNAVIEAMEHSNRPEVRGWAVVFKAAQTAEQLKGIAAAGPEGMNEDQIRATMGKAKELSSELNVMKSMLPEDLQKSISDVKLTDLPAQVDPTSRQVMFQQINLMMNQYQQIMQAMSEIINKMNEMAMDPIRKLGR